MSSQRVFRLAFWAFVASIGFSIVGSLLLYIPAASTFFTPYLGSLMKGPTWIYMALLPVLSLSLYWRELGPGRSLAFLAAGSLIGAGAELMGTQTGFPFGAYAYGDLLGAKIAGHVPWFIPPSWYALSVICLDLARRFGLGRAGRIVATAVLMVVWDVSLDPAMNDALPFWSYAIPENAGVFTDGLFFGMPLVNWGGWLLTSALIAAVYEALGGLTAAPTDFVARWAPPLYALNLFFPAAISLLNGVPWAGLIGLVAMAVPLLLLRRTPAPRLSAAAR